MAFASIIYGVEGWGQQLGAIIIPREACDQISPHATLVTTSHVGQIIPPFNIRAGPFLGYRSAPPTQGIIFKIENYKFIIKLLF